jgi:hypothetical protein
VGLSFCFLYTKRADFKWSEYMNPPKRPPSKLAELAAAQTPDRKSNDKAGTKKAGII